MRVLPVVAMTAPRFPLLKSYSRFILPPLLPGCTASRDEPNVLASIRVDQDQSSCQVIQAYRHEPLLALRCRVFSRNRLWIEQGTLGIREPNAVLPQIGLG